MNSRFRFFAIVLFSFLYIYNPAFSKISTIHFIAGISYIYIMFNWHAFNRLVSRMFIVYACLVLMMLLRLIVSFGTDSSLLGVLYEPLSMMIEMLPISAALAIMISNTKYSFETVLGGVVLIQDTICILSLLFPSFKSSIISLMIRSGYNEIVSFMQGHRMYGFSYTMPYGLPVIQSCIAIYYLFNVVKRKNTLWSFILFLFTALSAVLNARLSIGILGIGIIIVLIFVLASKRAFSPGFAAIVVAIVFMVTFAFNELEERNSFTYNWILEGVEDIANLITGQKLTRTSYIAYATNSENYQFPKGVSLIWGTGHITRNSIYNSDVGFINDIWLGGILYLLLEFVLAYEVLKTLISAQRLVLDKKEVFFKVLFILTALFVSNIKGRVFYCNEIVNIIFLIYAYSKQQLICNNQSSLMLGEINHTNGEYRSLLKPL